RTLADAIGLEPGERLLVRLPRPSAVAGDSLMADKDETVRSLTDLEVADVIPARGLGRFSLTPTQQEVTLAVLALEEGQRLLDEDQRINAILVARPAGPAPGSPDQVPPVPALALTPRLADLAMRLEQVRRTWRASPESPDEIAYEYLHL